MKVIFEKDEIKHITKKDKKLEKSNYSDSFVSGFHCCYCDIKQILDQIQGETKNAETK